MTIMIIETRLSLFLTGCCGKPPGRASNVSDTCDEGKEWYKRYKADRFL